MSVVRAFNWKFLPAVVRAAISMRGRISFGRHRRDDWLDRWLPLVKERAGVLPILEIGCGRGEDTLALVRENLAVTALDLSPAMIAAARKVAPQAQYHCQDVRAPFPIQKSGVAIASLSLHYFCWAEFQGILERIRNTLQPGGVFLCRLNSIRDVHFGAQGGAEIEHHFYRVYGVSKRFFDESDIRKAFADWRILSLEETTSDRFHLPKVLWEVVLERP
ncbi:class I SAM-dependent methyltransferase [Achromobacter aloeverae]